MPAMSRNKCASCSSHALCPPLSNTGPGLSKQAGREDEGRSPSLASVQRGKTAKATHNDQGTGKTTTPALLACAAPGAAPLLPCLRLGLLLLGRRWWGRSGRSSSSRSRREWRPSFTAQLGAVLRPRRTSLCTYDTHIFGGGGLRNLYSIVAHPSLGDKKEESQCPSPTSLSLPL